MRHAKLALGLLTAAIVLGCSPVARLRVSFALPKSAGPIDFAKLHVRGRVACDSFNLADAKPQDPQPPPAGPEEKDEDSALLADAGDAGDAGDSADGGDAGDIPRYRGRHEIRPATFHREDGFFHVSERGSSCRAAVTGWYDTNADGKPGPGDFVATLPTTAFHDRGLCAGNLTTVGPLEMKPWTP